MPCVNEQTVQDLVSGRLDADALARVEHHVGECSVCAQLVGLAAGQSGSRVVAGVGAGAGASGPAAPHEPAPSMGPGTMVGRYVLVGFLGAGGMGEVYAAFDPSLERKVAIKFLRPELVGRDDREVAAERMRREGRLVAKLSHPNVVVVYEIGVFADLVFIAMEHVDGQSLAEWLRAAPRLLPEIVRVFAAAGAGLAAAHAGGVVHRDFKPQNVMLGKGGEVRVMDFGLAHLDSDSNGAAPLADAPLPAGNDAASVTRLTRTGAVRGTPADMAPEQLRGSEGGAAPL